MNHKTEAVNEKELDIYYDHYKDTFTYVRKFIAQREKLFFMGIVTAFLITLTIQNLELATIIAKDLTLARFKIQSIEIDTNLINTCLQFAFLSIMVRYYQINLTIEKQYNYLHKIESELVDKMNQFEITREGISYLNNYPIVLSVIHWIYTLVVPTLVILITIIKYIKEFDLYTDQYSSVYFILNTIFSFLLISISILYLIWLHFRDFKKSAT